MSRSRRTSRTAVVGFVLLTASCGIPTGGEPETIATTDIPYGLASPTPAGTPTPSPPSRADGPRIYLTTTEGVLVSRGRAVEGGNVEQRLTRLLGDLAAGPTSEELEDQLTTALPPEVGLTATVVDAGTATIDISTGEDTPSGQESRRAVGQIVLTATSLPEVRGVLLTRDGEPLEVPLPSGELTSTPLTAADYAALLSSPPS